MTHNLGRQTSSAKQKPTYRTSDSFIESLRSIGQSTTRQAKDATVGAVASQTRRLFGLSEIQADNQYPATAQAEIEWQRRENTIRAQERTHAQYLRDSEQTVYDQREQEIKLQINAVRQSLRELVASVGQVAQNIDTAISQEITSPGTYHLNFFAGLLSRLKKIALLLKNIHGSTHWKSLSQERKNAMQGYWGQVKKSGTKYMLSHERTAATQTG